MDPTGDHSRDPLCALCQRFTNDLIASDFGRRYELPKDGMWTEKMISGKTHGFSGYGPGFIHYKTASDLENSAQSCAMCRAIWDGHRPEHRLLIRHLALFAGYYSVETEPKRSIQATSLDDRWQTTHGCAFDISITRPYEGEISSFCLSDRASRKMPDFARAIPDSSMSSDSFETARFWMKNCVENHSACSTPARELPTRIIDVGTISGAPASLLITNGVSGHYAALSHCWGGNIPCKMTKDNLNAYKNALPMHVLPQNFLDAITLTRELGLQYLWIDAVCIIQDSAEDWATEAARMANVYSNARVTISALDSAGSTLGFLAPRSHKRVNLGQGFIFSERPLDYRQAIAGGLLNSRGWCMQEWALSKFTLSIGREQMYWECPTITAREDGIPHDAYYYATPMSFEVARKNLSLGTTTSLQHWYTIVEEFSKRSLTFGEDKLPALAGVASRFGSTKIGGSYVAGLWAEETLQGILWRARTSGAYGKEFPPDLRLPAKPRAPSWSWASIDGEILFPMRVGKVPWQPHASIQVLRIDMNVAMNDFAAPKVEGALKLRGLIAKMRYAPGNRPKRSDAVHEGSLAFEGETRYGGTITMDRDRAVARDCWALVVGQRHTDILTLEEVGHNKFKRIGCGSRDLKLHGDDSFSLTDISLI
uniref:Heterokaryon incompatibility protein n=1 Tax=Colletotrichum fructicola (strain Nara gc5) TaxID=1213859 RepID=L2G597_COLFN